MRWLQRSVALSVLLCAPSAAAFTFQTPASEGCHERITADALLAARKEGRAPALGFTANERAFADDLPFTTPDGLDDLAGLSLLVGVRENDLRGRGPTDVEQLTQLHGDPDVQDEHCLRNISHDGEQGSAAAVQACRRFIKNKLISALDGLDARGLPDPSRRDRIRMTLAIRGSIEIDLPRFYLRMGQALHAAQDSFTHTYRTATGREITVVLNWIEHVDGKLVESRDGPPHLGALDQCDDVDEIRVNRRTWATSASTDFLRTALDTSLDREGKSAAFDRTLDQWVTFKGGCTEANGWCNAPEHALQDAGCGCTAPGRQTYGGLAVLIGIAALMLRRRGLAALVLLLLPTNASAAGDKPATAAEKKEAEADKKEAAAEKKEEAAADKKEKAADEKKAAAEKIEDAKPLDQKPAFAAPCPAPGEEAGVGEGVVSKGTKQILGDPTPRFGVHLGFGASLDQPALAGTIGVRYRLADTWLVGLNAEWNPWAAVFGKFRSGAVNAYGTVIKRWTIRSDTYALRSTFHLGTSTLLMNLYGAPSGSTGLFVGLSIIGLEVKISPGMAMVFSPAEIAIPAPQLKGLFVYPQYRFTIGLQWGAAGHH